MRPKSSISEGRDLIAQDPFGNTQDLKGQSQFANCGGLLTAYNSCCSTTVSNKLLLLIFGLTLERLMFGNTGACLEMLHLTKYSLFVGLVAKLCSQISGKYSSVYSTSN